MGWEEVCPRACRSAGRRDASEDGYLDGALSSTPLPTPRADERRLEKLNCGRVVLAPSARRSTCASQTQPPRPQGHTTRLSISTLPLSLPLNVALGHSVGLALPSVVSLPFLLLRRGNRRGCCRPPAILFECRWRSWLNRLDPGGAVASSRWTRTQRRNRRGEPTGFIHVATKSTPPTNR